jgi:hypothetical protein
VPGPVSDHDLTEHDRHDQEGELVDEPDRLPRKSRDAGASAPSIATVTSGTTSVASAAASAARGGTSRMASRVASTDRRPARRARAGWLINVKIRR